MRRGRVIGRVAGYHQRLALAVRYAAGAPARELAAEIGVNKDTVLRWLRDLGCEVRTRGAAKKLTQPPIAERFARKYVVLDNGCWKWIGARSKDGYGLFRSPGESKAHRYSYKAHVGPIPAGLEIDHLCLNPFCVNPLHLEPVTHEENIRRFIRSMTLRRNQNDQIKRV